MLQILNEIKIPVLSLDKLLSPTTTCGVAITFDDGMVSLFESALPILREHGVPAHLFLTTGAVGGDNAWPGQPPHAAHYQMLTWQQVEALYNAGIAIEAHTAHHLDLRKLSREQVHEEMSLADEVIERYIGRRPAYFAYPYGYHSPAVCAVAQQRYAASFTTKLAFLRSDDAPERLPRLDSYYLQHPWLVRNLATSFSQSYISLRRCMRYLCKRD